MLIISGSPKSFSAAVQSLTRETSEPVLLHAVQTLMLIPDDRYLRILRHTAASSEAGLQLKRQRMAEVKPILQHLASRSPYPAVSEAARTALAFFQE